MWMIWSIWDGKKSNNCLDNITVFQELTTYFYNLHIRAV